MNVKIRDFGLIVLIAASVVAIDMMLIPILQETGYSQESPTGMYVYDFIYIIFVGLLGLIIVSRTNLPLWWRSGDNSKESRRDLKIVLLVGFVAVVFNTISHLAAHHEIIEISPWILKLTPSTALISAIFFLNRFPARTGKYTARS